MNQVVALEVKFNAGNESNTIYPVIVKDEEEMILIDCGYPNFLPLIKKAAESRGINLDEVTKIVITHHDHDHIGALADFKKQYPNVVIISSEIDERYISGKEKSLRLQQAEALFDSLPDDEKPFAEGFHKLLQSVGSVGVDTVVKDKDVFSWAGGFEIVATPGHMPGHICVYLREFKTLIAGDALVVENDELSIPNQQYTLDMDEAKRSIKKLLAFDIEQIICYHGGVYTRDIKGSLEKLI